MSAGHVYILLNPTMPGYLKIGKTTRSPEERARELSQSTGVIVPYTVAYSEELVDCEAAESSIHLRLAKFRANRGREFFYLPLRDAIRELSAIAEEVGRLDCSASGALNGISSSSELRAIELDDRPSQLINGSETATASISPTPTEQGHINALPSELRAVYLEIRSLVRAFSAGVDIYATNKNVVFKANKVFAEIQPRKSALRFLIRREGFDIPERASIEKYGVLVTRVPDKHQWTLNHQFLVNGTTSLKRVSMLLKQSYDAVAQ